MRKNGIFGRVRRKKPWFKSTALAVPVENILNRNFKPAAMNQAWVVDFRYIATSDGFLYLAVVMDLFSRRIVGGALSASTDGRFVVQALKEAVQNRQPSIGLVHHSDQGSVYTAVLYGQLLVKHGLTPSMSRRGNCHDNAVVENFFSTLERDLLIDLKRASRHFVAAQVLEYIDQYYNHTRIHAALAFTPPIEHEMKKSA